MRLELTENPQFLQAIGGRALSAGDPRLDGAVTHPKVGLENGAPHMQHTRHWLRACGRPGVLRRRGFAQEFSTSCGSLCRQEGVTSEALEACVLNDTPVRRSLMLLTSSMSLATLAGLAGGTPHWFISASRSSLR